MKHLSVTKLSDEQHGNMFVKSVHTTQNGIRSLSYTGPKLWNSLSIDVKKINHNLSILYFKALICINYNYSV